MSAISSRFCVSGGNIQPSRGCSSVVLRVKEAVARVFRAFCVCLAQIPLLPEKVAFFLDPRREFASSLLKIPFEEREPILRGIFHLMKKEKLDQLVSLVNQPQDAPDLFRKVLSCSTIEMCSEDVLLLLKELPSREFELNRLDEFLKIFCSYGVPNIEEQYRFQVAEDLLGIPESDRAGWVEQFVLYRLQAEHMKNGFRVG